MNIEVKIVAPGLEQALNNLAAAINARQGTTDVDASLEKPKRAARSAKGETTTPDTSDQTEADGPEAGAKAPAEESTGSAGGPSMSYETDIKAPFLKLASEKGRDAAIALLKPYNASSAQGVPEDAWPAFREAIDAALLA